MHVVRIYRLIFETEVMRGSKNEVKQHN